MNFQEAYNRIKGQIEKLGIFQFKEEWSEAECITAFESAENKNIAAIEDSNKKIIQLQETISSLAEKVNKIEIAEYLTKDHASVLISEKITESNKLLSDGLKKEFAEEVEGIKKLAITAGSVVTGDGNVATRMDAGMSNENADAEEEVEVRTKMFNKDAVIKVKKSQVHLFQNKN